MDKKRIEIIITSVLVVVFVLAWANSIKLLRQRSRGKSGAAPSAAAVASARISTIAVPAAATTPKLSKKAEKKDLSWLRDPFSGKIYASRETGASFALEGILWDPVNPRAVINNDLYSEGDKISDFHVVDIQKDNVTLSDGDKNINLELE